MHSRLFRILAVALLVLGLPLQGMASVASAQCMAFGHHDAGGPDHEHQHDDGGEGHDHAAGAHPEDGKGAHCGPCTACCASVTIAGTARLPIISWPSNTKYVFSQLAPPGVEPQRFDRPPLAL